MLEHLTKTVDNFLLASVVGLSISVIVGFKQLIYENLWSKIFKTNNVVTFENKVMG